MKYGKKLKTQSSPRLHREFTAKLFSVVLPIAFQQFMLALVSASDAVMLGKTHSLALSKQQVLEQGVNSN